MKGVVFNLLEEVVTREYGADVWDDLIDAAGVGGAYTSLGNYSDEEIEALVAAAAAKLGSDRAAVLRWFGQKAMPILAELYPSFFDGLDSSKPFVLGVNHIIHAEVRKLYTGAECPHFHFTEEPDGAWLARYRSSRRMCALAQGFVEGASAQFGDNVRFEHVECVEHDAPQCTFRLSW